MYANGIVNVSVIVAICRCCFFNWAFKFCSSRSPKNVPDSWFLLKKRAQVVVVESKHSPLIMERYLALLHWDPTAGAVPGTTGGGSTLRFLCPGCFHERYCHAQMRKLEVISKVQPEYHSLWSMMTHVIALSGAVQYFFVNDDYTTYTIKYYQQVTG